MDEAGRAQFFALLDSIFPDAAKLIITHDISVASRCDRVLVLCGGRVTAIIPAKFATKELLGMKMTGMVSTEEMEDDYV